MRRAFKYLALAVVLSLGLGLGYGVNGYLDARTQTEGLMLRADALIAQGRGADGLGRGRLAHLLMVQDPSFFQHSGVDISTPGAGATTISQSLSKRLAFDQFRPGIGKIRQTGYALGLEHDLSKEQILALWLDTVEMGRGPQGWMSGFFQASDAIYQRPPADLSEAEFLSLVAVLIAPGSFDLGKDDPDLAQRAARIKRLIAGECTPIGHSDVWLEGCQ